jgi:hypothetical protein
MNGERKQISCRTCGEVTLLKASGDYEDGSQRLLCSCCEKDGGVLHKCAHDHVVMAPKWPPLLTAGIGIVCPQCKKAYDLGVSIEPTYPQVGQALKNVGLFVGTIILLSVLVDLLRGREHRR